MNWTFGSKPNDGEMTTVTHDQHHGSPNKQRTI